MGVQGLTPFLQRHCPQVVKSLPERLRDFGGKTIVFDGTLLTHRFHFAPSPHQYRHILGWYNLITELRGNDVNAICVFDGVGRSAAKVLENERRQSARQLCLARWSMEIKRQQRLQSLSRLVQRYQNLPFEKRIFESSKFKYAISRKDLESRKTVSEYLDLAPEDNIEGQSVTLWPTTEAFENQNIPAASEDFSPGISHALSSADPVQGTGDSLIQDEDFLVPEERSPPSLRYDLSEQFNKLYESHKSTERTIRAIAAPTIIPTDSPEEASESKNQLALTQDEDLLWSEIHLLIGKHEGMEKLVSLEQIIGRSKALSESYERRCKPPTQETYMECKMMLQALGVPCIEARSPYEAEGLASSIVRRGLAHFVASEDTDVLLYGAPLLRNLASRHGAIVAISSEEVRRALHLSRAAFMDFALLIGTDFCPRLRNVGPVRALNVISAHSRIERVVKREPRYAPSDVADYLWLVRRARRIFTTLPPIPPKERLKPLDVDKERVTELLGQFGLSRAALDGDWDPRVSLAGNYFADNPIGSGMAIGAAEMHFF